MGIGIRFKEDYYYQATNLKIINSYSKFTKIYNFLIKNE